MKNYATVTKIEYLNDERDMYDLTVDEDHSYMLASGIYSHNSALALNIAINQARIGARVSFTSLEMDTKENSQRILSNLTGIPLSQIERVKDMDRATKRMIIDAWRDFHNQVKKNGGRFKLISPEEDVSIEELLTSLKGRGFQAHIIDYMGLLKGMDGDDQWRKLGAATRYAKVYTRSDSSSVILLAQLSAEGEIRYSRTIKEHASLMWQWQRPDETGIITVKQPKTRNLKSFDFPLQQNHTIMRVTDVDMQQLAAIKKAKPSDNKRGDRRSKPEPLPQRKDLDEGYQL